MIRSRPAASRAPPAPPSGRSAPHDPATRSQNLAAIRGRDHSEACPDPRTEPGRHEKTTLLRQRTDAAKPLEASTAGQIMNDLALCHVHAPAPRHVLPALDIHHQTGTTFCDAIIAPT